jgi:hypothetical protein
VILDDVMPEWDATRIEHRVVAGPRAEVYPAALALDFLEVPRAVPVVAVLFGVRSAGERLVTAVRRRPRAAAAVPATMRLSDLPERGEWARFGDAPPNEIVFGAVGRFWAGETTWLPTDAESFAAFAEPGYARIGCNLSFRDYGSRTLVSYEARTRATDAASRAAFGRYWRVVDPFVGVVMRGTLRLLERTVAEPEPTLGNSSSDDR